MVFMFPKAEMHLEWAKIHDFNLVNTKTKILNMPKFSIGIQVLLKYSKLKKEILIPALLTLTESQ